MSLIKPAWRARAFSLLLVAVVGAAWLFTLPRLQITTSITHFLPDAADKRAALLAKAIAEGELSNTLVLDLSGDEAARLGETATKLVAALRVHPETKSVRSGLDDSGQEGVFHLLADRSPTALLRVEDFEDDAIVQHLDRLKAKLASPMGPFVRQLAIRDPLGGVLDTLDQLAELAGNNLSSKGGVLFTVDEKHAFVFVVSRGSAFDASAQRAYLDDITTAFKAARASPAQRLEMSGIARFTIASEAQIRGDIERIGGLSTVGILVLFVFLFRSVRMVGLGLVPLWFGSAVAIVSTHLVFGEIHGLTLAFGTSLLGVGIDYAEHYFAHYALAPEHGAERTMAMVWPGLWMGAVTTIFGFAGLGFTGFPGVRQIAFFSAASIVGALFGTRWLVPPWMPHPYKRSKWLGPVEVLAARTIDIVRPRRFWLVIASIVLALAFVPGLARTRFVDDVAVLLALDADLVAEDARVRDRVSPLDPGRFVVVLDQDEETALRALGDTTAALELARRDGLLDGYVPLGSVLRSEAAQRASFERAKEKRERLTTILSEQGFVPSLFSPFFEALDRPGGPAVLRMADVRASPLGDLVGPLSPRLAQGQAFVIPLRGVHDLAALRARLPAAVMIDQVSLLEGTYREVRKRTTLMLFVGLVLVIGTLVLRYRSPRLVLAAFLPGALGAAGALGLCGMFGTPLNLLHFVAILLVLSMGVDYGIFLVEGRGNSEDGARSLVSIATATSTTLLSFGLLALSPSPALRTLGINITVGLLLSAAFCPVALVVLGVSWKREEPKP